MRGFIVYVAVCLLACIVSSVHSKRISQEDVNRALRGYDKNEPPNPDGSTDTRVGFYMNNLILQYESGIMRMNIYLRMAWQDERLRKIFDGSDDEKYSLSDDHINAVWTPDLFVRNSDSAERVDAIHAEQLFRVNKTGHAWFVVRLINNVYCPQLLSGNSKINCSMMFESFSYTMDELKLSFLENPADFDESLTLRSHHIHAANTFDCSQNYTAGRFPCLEFKMELERDISDSTFEAGIYLVSIMLVIISWLGFWIPPSDRRILVGIGIAIILSLFYMVVAEWREFSYADRTTHAQIWVIFCLVLVLGMVLEFAVVYVVFGTLKTRVKGLCGDASQPDDLEVKRSKCGDVVDTIFGAIIFPVIFIIGLITFGTTTIAFK